MTKFITVTAMLGTTSVLAETPYPPPIRDGRERILRTGTCPTGYVGKGNECETLHRDNRAPTRRSGVAPARRHVPERRRMQGVPVKKIAPCNSQPPEQVEAYYRNVKPGDAASLRPGSPAATYSNISSIRSPAQTRSEDGSTW